MNSGHCKVSPVTRLEPRQGRAEISRGEGAALVITHIFTGLVAKLNLVAFANPARSFANQDCRRSCDRGNHLVAPRRARILASSNRPAVTSNSFVGSSAVPGQSNGEPALPVVAGSLLAIGVIARQ